MQVKSCATKFITKFVNNKEEEEEDEDEALCTSSQTDQKNLHSIVCTGKNKNNIKIKKKFNKN